MLPEDREWFRLPGATAPELAHLRAASPVELPQAYYDLLAHSNGGEGPLAVQPYNFVLDSADVAAAAVRTKPYGPGLEDFLIIGGDGGGEFIAFDLRTAMPWPIVNIDMVAGPASAAQIASDFDAFLAMVGVEQQDG